MGEPRTAMMGAGSLGLSRTGTLTRLRTSATTGRAVLCACVCRGGGGARGWGISGLERGEEGLRL